MKEKIIKIYNDNKLVFDIVICLLCIISLFVVPSFFAVLINYVINSEMVSSILSDIIYTILLLLIFKDSLIKEFKIFKKSLKKSLSIGTKYYIIGICFMIAINLVITFKLGAISTNESLVREYIVKYSIYALISVMVIAPLTEELIFRKSIMNTTKNKYIGTIISGLIFGLVHVISYIESPIDLVYILPYAALGCSFAYMDYECKSIYPSILFHSFHNTLSFCLVLFASSVGAL